MGHSFGYQILFYIFWILLPCQWYSYDIIINPQLMMSALLGFSVIVFSLFIEAWRSVISNPPKRARHAIPLVNRRWKTHVEISFMFSCFLRLDGWRSVISNQPVDEEKVNKRNAVTRICPKVPNSRIIDSHLMNDSSTDTLMHRSSKLETRAL